MNKNKLENFLNGLDKDNLLHCFFTGLIVIVFFPIILMVTVIMLLGRYLLEDEPSK